MKAKKKAAPAALPTVRFPLERLDRLAKVLDALGYEMLEPPPHARLAAKGEDARITVYGSGKLLVQGKGAEQLWSELAAFELVPAADGGAAPARPAAKPGPAATSSAPMAGGGEATVGSDETGKGDYFGRLVVCACRVDAATADELRAMGVDDSKKLSDARALGLAKRIRAICPVEVVSISPRRYNELYAKIGNLNRLLAWAHGRAIEGLLERAPATRIAVDRFAGDPRVLGRALGERGRALPLREEPRLESSEPAVAAASVVARAEFLRTLDELSKRFDIELPKGAGRPVDEAGRRFIATHGRAALGEVAKLHFRTTDKL